MRVDQHHLPTYITIMKPVQVMMEEGLLKALDADEEVRRLGRSAVLRKIVAEYLERERRRAILREYRAAYGAGGLEKEFGGWEEQGEWPQQ